MAGRFILDLDGEAPEAERRSRFYYRPFGAARELFDCRAAEVLLEGPKDTGKTRACLTYVLTIASRYPGSRGLICRKSRASLTQSIQVTLERKVVPPRKLHFHGTRQEYQLTNGSVMVLGGLNDPDSVDRVQSSEYDWIYVPEATEMSKIDIEMLSGLLRNGTTPYSQLVMDCNPRQPTHHLNVRCSEGKTQRLRARHTDNPSITPERLARLEAMTGVRRKRLYEGIWAAAEGMVYDAYDPAVHVVPQREIPKGWRWYWAVDFGFVNPFVWQSWAEAPDGDLVMVREIYKTRTLVEDHAAAILDASANDPRPDAIVCDHDAEDRATLERHLGMRTVPAFKAVKPGIEAVASRMQSKVGRPPRLRFMADALVTRDVSLDEPDEGPARPAATIEEIESYVWNGTKDQPVKSDDHGCDAMRYLVAYIDKIHLSNTGAAVPDTPDARRANTSFTGNIMEIEL